MELFNGGGFQICFNPPEALDYGGWCPNGVLTLIASSCFIKTDMERPNQASIFENNDHYEWSCFSSSNHIAMKVCHLEVWWLLLVKEVTFRWCR